jgi:hypothetical protein
MSDPLLQIADPIVGMVLLACGVVVWVRKSKSRVGVLLVVAGGCWFLGSLWSAAIFLHRGHSSICTCPTRLVECIARSRS